MAKLVAQGDAPQPDHRMRLSVGGGNRKLCVLLDQRLVEPCHQIPRQKRTIRRRAQHMGYLRSVLGRPVEAGQNAGQGAGKIRDRIRNHRQAE
jgi:hypothetical protein